MIVRNAGTSEYSISTNVSFTLATDEHYLTFLGSADLTGTGTGTKNVFTGNTGHNTFVGGPGDNDYFVRHSDDVITATLNPGHVNRVYADVSFTLPTNVQELVLLGSGNLTGTGNSLDNVIYSNSGRDILIGGGGNDTFIVHDSGDQVIAADDGGNNAVFADVSFVLPANVKTLVLMGSANLTATGNNLDNTLYSNTGVDTLIGRHRHQYVRRAQQQRRGDRVARQPEEHRVCRREASRCRPMSSNSFSSAPATSPATATVSTTPSPRIPATTSCSAAAATTHSCPARDKTRSMAAGGINSIEFTGMRSDYRTTGLPGGGLQIVDQRNGSPDGTSTTSAVQVLQVHGCDPHAVIAGRDRLEHGRDSTARPSPQRACSP